MTRLAPLWIGFLCCTALPASAANASSLEQCDRLFEERSELNRALESVLCYSSFLRTHPSDEAFLKAAFENAFAALDWLYQHGENANRRDHAVATGLDLAQRAKKNSVSFAMGLYWEARFTYADCLLKDAERPFPTCMLFKKGEIVRLLDRTRELNARIDGHGADRMLGVFFRIIPLFPKRDLARSEVHLRYALEYSPSHSANYLEYARTLFRLGRTELARSVLADLVSHDCVTMNPFRALECEKDQREAKALLKP